MSSSLTPGRPDGPDGSPGRGSDPEATEIRRTEVHRTEVSPGGSQGGRGQGEAAHRVEPRPDTGRDETTRTDHTRVEHDRPRGAGTGAAAGAGAGGLTSKEVVRAQKERFGGMKFGACFFGWLTATGTAVLLTALLASVGAAVGLANGVTSGDAAQNPQTVGLAGGIALLVILFLSYLAGGYVAGRMARFSGVKQGIGVWLWALIIAVVVAVLSLVAGSQFNLLGSLNGVPRIPVSQDALTTGGILTAIGVVLVSLLGAILGGLAGMRFHRRVDRASLDS